MRSISWLFWQIEDSAKIEASDGIGWRFSLIAIFLPGERFAKVMPWL
jgi:hypothetical protein